MEGLIGKRSGKVLPKDYEVRRQRAKRQTGLGQSSVAVTLIQHGDYEHGTKACCVLRRLDDAKHRRTRSSSKSWTRWCSSSMRTFQR